MFIQTETTPNPDTLKFVPGVPVTGGAGLDFAHAEAARGVSPLAESLFSLEGVSRVYLGADFVSVACASGAAGWDLLRPAVLGAIMEHLVAERPVVLADADTSTADEQAAQADDSPVAKQVRELLETYVRPAVAQDGGDVVFRGFDAGVVYLHMQGACAGCPSSSATLKLGIERLLRHHIPEVVEVRAVA